MLTEGVHVSNERRGQVGVGRECFVKGLHAEEVFGMTVMLDSPASFIFLPKGVNAGKDGVVGPVWHGCDTGTGGVAWCDNGRMYNTGTGGVVW